MRSQFGIESLSSGLGWFFLKDKVNSSQNITFLKIGAVNKDIKIKLKFGYTHGHNILRSFDDRPKFSVTTGQTKPDL